MSIKKIQSEQELTKLFEAVDAHLKEELTLYIIGGAHMIASGSVGRETKEEEWEFGRLWARQYDANEDWPKAIDELVLSLQERQKNRG